MRDYQRNRILMLISSDIDPLGSGYHIIQSKIAIGSGGLFGKGLFNGTQSQLDFLPERHTDFIFAVFSEEFGYLGILLLLFMYWVIIVRGFLIAIRIQNIFCRLIVGDFIFVFFMCIFINIGMVSGILPVVGVPLPLVSYGGSSLFTFMIEFGILMSVSYQQKKGFLSKKILY